MYIGAECNIIATHIRTSVTVMLHSGVCNVHTERNHVAFLQVGIELAGIKHVHVADAHVVA